MSGRRRLRRCRSVRARYSAASGSAVPPRSAQLIENAEFDGGNVFVRGKLVGTVQEDGAVLSNDGQVLGKVAGEALRPAVAAAARHFDDHSTPQTRARGKCNRRSRTKRRKRLHRSLSGRRCTPGPRAQR
jgi:hypothetical protein